MGNIALDTVLHTDKYVKRTEFVIGSCLRYVIAITFILSGMLKGGNPDGFSQNAGAFLDLFGMTTSHAFEIAVFVCTGEIILGYAALNRKIFIHIHWVYSIVMVVFTYITYVNFTDTYGGIESCGCFGEFIHLDPTQSFYKNLVLLLICVALNLHNAIASTIQEPLLIFLSRELPTIAFASVLPIGFSIIFMHTISQSAYLFIYVAICVISLVIVISKHKYCAKRFTSHVLLIGLSAICASCNGQIENALASAGDNRAELEKVLEHFRNDPNPLKYEAAKFLISNMPYHSSCTGKAAEQYDSAFLAMAKEPIQFRDSVFRHAAEGIAGEECCYRQSPCLRGCPLRRAVRRQESHQRT